MLILLPPSETKRPGGAGISIDKAAIIWAALDPTRELIISALSELCTNSEAARRALKLGPRGGEEIQKNLSLLTAPTMPALERYSGVLFDAIGFHSLSSKALKNAHEKLFIQSALFGLLPAMEQIPDYRFSAVSQLAGVNLKKIWRESHQAVWPRMVGQILDMRSQDYQELNPVPTDRESFVVEVLSSEGKALNHFNKKAKGMFVRSALEEGLEDITKLPDVAHAAGLRAETTGRTVQLFTP